MFSSKILRRFDFHTKTIDGVKGQQTVIGALITIVAVIVVFGLFVMEIVNFGRSTFVNKMVLDSSVGGEDIAILFDLEFARIPCYKIKYIQEVTRGTLHWHAPDRISKDPLEGGIGCRVHGVTVTDKATGSFRFMIDPPPLDLFLNSELPEDRIDDLSHVIKTLAFVPANRDGSHDYIAPGQEHEILQKMIGRHSSLASPLRGQSTAVSPDIAIQQYNLQVVPTMYEGRQNEFSNQYTSVERQITVNQLRSGVILSGQTFKQTAGVVFSYDFYPITLVRSRLRLSFLTSLTNLLAIIGGAITVFGLLERFLNGSAKAMIGKKD